MTHASAGDGAVSGAAHRPHPPRRTSWKSRWSASDDSTALYRNGYALVAGGAVTAALGVAYWLVAARSYSADTLGTQSAVIAALSLLSGLGQLSFSAAVVRFLPVAGTSSRRLIVVAYGVAATIGLIGAFVFTVASGSLSPKLSFLASDYRWLVAFSLGSAGMAIFALQDSVLIASRRGLWVAVENTTFSLAKIAVLLAFARSAPAAGLFASWVVPGIVGIVIVNSYVFKRLFVRDHDVRPAVEFSRRAVLRFAGATFSGSVALLALVPLLPLIVIHRSGSLATAYFTVPWAIATSLQLGAWSFAQSLTVETVLNRQNLRNYARGVLLRVFALVGCSAVVIFAGAHWLLSLFGDAYAREATSLLRMLAVAAVLNVAVAVGVGVARALDWPTLVGCSQALTAAVLLGLSYALLPSLGIGGVGIASIAAQGAAIALLGYVFTKRFRRTRGELKPARVRSS